MGTIIIGTELKDFPKDQLTLITFNPSEFWEDGEKKGFIPRYVEAALDINTPKLPAIYEINKQVRILGREKRSYATKASLQKEVNLPSKDPLWLVIGIMKIINYKPSKDEKPKNGIKFWAINPIITEDENHQGSSILEDFIEGATEENFPNLPGYYEINFTEKRGKNGIEIIKTSRVSFKERFTFEGQNQQQENKQ